MRIVSQDKRYDFPYEDVSVFRVIDTVLVNFWGIQYLVANYSSEEKAKKAMDMLLMDFSDYESNVKLMPKNYESVFFFPADGDL